jgi:hypothetical protein
MPLGAVPTSQLEEILKLSPSVGPDACPNSALFHQRHVFTSRKPALFAQRAERDLAVLPHRVLVLTAGGRRILAGGSLAWPVFKALVTPPIKHSGNEPVRVGL